jgi:hypothetical protein
MMRKLRCLAVISFHAVAITPCAAAETVTYKYDALGRLEKVATTGGPNNDVQTTYKFDKADNREQVTIVNAKSRVVVVPLNGLTVIPIPDP